MKHSKDGLVWHSFSIFEAYPELRHGYFTKAGGVSGGGVLNLAFTAGGQDSAEKVMANIDKAAGVLGLPAPAFVRQTHSDAVSMVRPGDHYQPRSPEDVREGFDAMVAPGAGVSLLIKVADCQGVLLYDPVAKIVGLAHSGWRGSVRNILAKTVARMAEEGAEPGRMLAGIAPSLGPCCAEFVNFAAELPEEFWAFRVNEKHFDFWAISRRQLTACGLKPENIETAGVCTKCSPDYFSYRRGDSWGRFGVIAGLPSESV